MIITLLTWIDDSWFMIPPVFAPRGVWLTLVWRLTMFTPSTCTRCLAVSTEITLPSTPLSRPAMTITVSPFLIFMSQHLRCERDDAHEPLLSQLAADRPENAGSARVTAVPNEDSGIFVEANVGAVDAAALLLGPHDDRLDDLTLLDAPAWDGVLNGCDDDVTDARVAPPGAAEHADAQQLLGTRVVGDAQSRLLLDH